jgi:hypothetical protein
MFISFMDIERIKLITKNLEALIRCLNEEIYSLDSPSPSHQITPLEEDYDEVYVDEN